MSDLSPRIVFAESPEGPQAQLLGRWGAAELGHREHWHALAAQLRKQPVPPGGWDLRSLQWLDHVGAQLLWKHWGQKWPQHLQLTDPQRAMLERVASLTVVPPPAEPWRLSEQMDHLGVLVLHGADHARHMVQLVGQLMLDLVRLARAPGRGPWRDVSGHVYRMGATALPITALVGFLIGVVLAYLMSLQLRQFGAESFIVNILGISLIRELGPMLAAILAIFFVQKAVLTALTGSSFGQLLARIGIMRLDGSPVGFLRSVARAAMVSVVVPAVVIGAERRGLDDLVLGTVVANRR